MSQNSKIEWTDHTFNPWWGCVKVSPGCDNCYAERDSRRYGFDVWGPKAERRLFGDDHWRQPLLWNRQAEKAGIPAKVFCGSMCDVFERHPHVATQRSRLWQLIEQTPWLIWQLLTKRPENIGAMIPYSWKIHTNFGDSRWPSNVQLGVSVESQEHINRVARLLDTYPPVAFVSCEPLLGPVDLRLVECSDGDSLGDGLCNLGLNQRIDWIIAGGESGPKARPTHPDWLRSLRDQCQIAGVPFFFKQWGEWIAEYPQGLSMANRSQTFEHGCEFYKVGKNLAGRLLDGREWNEFPDAYKP